MADVVREIRDRLKAGGWSEKRTGKSEVWAHPNGAIYPLSTSMRDQGRTKDNALAAIARLERTGNPLARQKVEPPPPTPPPPPSVPVKEPKARVTEVLAKPESRLEWFTWVKNTREAASLSTDDVAGLLGAGVTSGMVRKIERGLRRFSQEEFTAWLALFEVTVPEGLEVPLATDADMAKRKGHARAKALGAAMHDTLVGTTNPPKPYHKSTGPCKCPKCRMGITDWDGEGLPPTPTLPADAAPIPEPPKEEPVPAEPAPVIVPEVPPSRAEAVAMVTKILSNPRLTDEEALALAKDTVASATRVLLGL